jgi:hypothetical protein
MLLVLAIPCVAHAQELTVVAVSHHTQEYDYNVSSPANSNTNCNADVPTDSPPPKHVPYFIVASTTSVPSLKPIEADMLGTGMSNS